MPFFKKKGKQDEKTAAVVKTTTTTTNVTSSQLSSYERTTTTSIVERTRLTSTGSALSPPFPSTLSPLSLNKQPTPLRSSTKRDWRPYSATETTSTGLTTGEFHTRLSDWSLRDSANQASTSIFRTQPLPMSTDAIPIKSNSSFQPYKSAFSNTTYSNYGAIRKPPPVINVTPARNTVSTIRNVAPIKSIPLGAAASTIATAQESPLKIVVTKSIRFCDANSTVPTYNTKSKHRGKALVINNIVFDGGHEKEREGAEFDHANIIELFKQMGFKVQAHKNKSKKEIQSIIQVYRKDKGLSKYDINVVVIMSHGHGNRETNSTQIATSDKQLISTASIIEEFDGLNCPSLQGKPKIFIFQCCRGDQHDRIAVDSALIKPPRIQEDMLMAYSTIPGYVSHRDPKTGTWYIQAICEVFMRHAHKEHVEDLLKLVDTHLAEKITSYPSRQTSTYENRGFKKCYLHPGL